MMLLNACIEDIDYNGPDSKSMLVVNCIAQDSTVPMFHLSRSRSFLEYYRSNDDLTSNVNVQISINGNTMDAVYYDSVRAFTDNRIVRQGDVITVTASHPEYGRITATDTVPYAQECKVSQYIKKYSHKNTVSEAFDDTEPDFDDNLVDSTWVVELEIQGRKDIDDFYMLKIDPSYSFVVTDLKDSTVDTVSMSLHYMVPATTKMLMELSNDATAVLEETEADSQFEFYANEYTFPDHNIKDGSKLSFEMLMEKPDTANFSMLLMNGYGYGFGGWMIPDSIQKSRTYSFGEIRYRLDVTLLVVSSAYYYYQKTVDDYENADLSLMSEPVTILHNVKGGAGILGAYTKKKFTLELVREF